MLITKLKQITRNTPILNNIAYRSRYAYRSFRGKNELSKLLKETAAPYIVIGCDETSFDGWINTDIETLDLLKPEDWEPFFSEKPIAAILAEHVWEHLTPEEGVTAAATCYRFLKPGGYVRAAVPDGNHPDPKYIEQVKIGGTGHSAHDHKVLYTVDTFCQTFQKAGFEVQPLEYFDQNGNFHHEPWVTEDGYIRRSLEHDPRNKDGRTNYSSIILDAVKPKTPK